MLLAIEREAAMDRSAEIRAAQERVIAVFRKKPKAAFSSVRASAHVGEGLTCKFRQGDHECIDRGASSCEPPQQGRSPCQRFADLLHDVTRL